MSAALGWALAAAALAVGYVQWGWRGVVLAATVIAFWLLLQFSRALRVLRNAGRAPIGQVASAVMLHARLQAGQRLPQILALTSSLGTPQHAAGGDPEVFEWRDGGGDAVRVELVGGKLARWQLIRAVDAAAAPPATNPGGEP
ncbi:MAG: hypothetical protein HS128_18305 [Ideonella sp.]|nr:hypothetical protein [Ideonella sp.]MCC7457691.1 hypothetical protein [Nitrospira sp.]